MKQADRTTFFGFRLCFTTCVSCTVIHVSVKTHQKHRHSGFSFLQLQTSLKVNYNVEDQLEEHTVYNYTDEHKFYYATTTTKDLNLQF